MWPKMDSDEKCNWNPREIAFQTALSPQNLWVQDTPLTWTTELVRRAWESALSNMSASSPPSANQKRCSSCAKVKAIEEFSGKKFTRVVNLDLLIYASGQVVQPAIPAVSTNVASAQQKCLITDKI